MSMLRKKKSTFDESDLPTDNWIWGNNRGGGGAPLKDHDGNDVANLKKVFTGAVEVDHSPSPNAKFKGKQGFRDYEDEPNEPYGNTRNNRRDSGDSGYRQPQALGGRGGPQRNNRGYDDSDGDDRRGGRNNGRNDGRNDGNNTNNAPIREKRQSAYRNNAGDDGERVIPGLNDRAQNYNDPNSPRHVHNMNGVASPPKKFMSAIKDLTGGGDTRERDIKLRKQQEYQDLLKQQIDEKKRKKDQEQRELDAIKARELQEYMAQHNRLAPNGSANVGNANVNGGAVNKNENLQSSMDPQYPPRHPQGSKFAPDNDRDGRGGGGRGGGGYGGGGYDSEEDPPARQQVQGRKGVPSMQLPGVGNNGNKQQQNRRGGSYSEDGEEDYPEPRRGGDQGYGGRGGRGAQGRDQDRGQGAGQGRGNFGAQGRGRAAQYDSETDDRSYRSDDNHSGSGDSGGGGRGRRGGGRGGGGGRSGGGGDGYVAAEEYDELSKLCDKLLGQQETLQEEVRKQAEMLKALGRNKAGGVGARGAAANGPTRAGAAALGVSPSKMINRSKSAINPSRGKEPDPYQNIKEKGGRAASNMRAGSEKETEKERLKREKEYLKSFEPIKRGPVGKDGKQARPSSMHALGASKRQEPEEAPRKGVKIAFGSNRDLDKNNTGAQQGGSRLAQQGAKAVAGGRGGAADGNGKPGAFSGVPRQGGRDSSGAGGGGGGGGAVNGFAKLALGGNKVGGPVMVVHDEEPVGVAGRRRAPNANANTPSPVRAAGRSMELRGNSEYIPMGDGEGIGGDQLEKLLHKSRQVRY